MSHLYRQARQTVKEKKDNDAGLPGDGASLAAGFSLAGPHVQRPAAYTTASRRSSAVLDLKVAFRQLLASPVQAGK